MKHILSTQRIDTDEVAANSCGWRLNIIYYYSSELEEVYEQFNQWLNDPIVNNESGEHKARELDSRDLAVIRWVNLQFRKELQCKLRSWFSFETFSILSQTFESVENTWLWGERINKDFFFITHYITQEDIIFLLQRWQVNDLFNIRETRLKI